MIRKTSDVLKLEDLTLEILDSTSAPLVRLFRHPGGDWTPPAPIYRNLRVDAPEPDKNDYAILYTGDSVECVAMECRVLSEDRDGNLTWSKSKAEQYEVVRYEHTLPAIFLPTDGSNRPRLNLRLGGEEFGTYAPFQRMAHEVYERLGKILHGFCWHSFHRGQPGRVYAIWHHRKKSMGLTIHPAAPYKRLIDDPEWQSFVSACPGLEQVD